MNKITDAFSTLIDLELPYTTAIVEGTLTGYRQAIAQIEPQLNERLEALKR
jgi:hypothetical protein